MIGRYLKHRMRRALAPSLACALAVAIMMVVLTVATAMPSMVRAAGAMLDRQKAGSANISVTISSESTDRFFALSRLKENEVLQQNADLVAGYFELFAQITSNADTGYCTLYAVDYQLLHTYNPIVSNTTPTIFGNADVALGESLAKKLGVRLYDRITLNIGGESVAFNVAVLAKKEGLFFAGDVALISSNALKRLNPLLGTDLVTHGLVRAKSMDAQAAILAELATDTRFAATRVDENAPMDTKLKAFEVPAILVGIVAAAFCIVSLAALVRLSFARDRENFALLRMLGMRPSQVLLASVLCGAAICLMAIVLAIGLDVGILMLFRLSSPLYRSASFGILPRVLGYGVGLGAGLTSTLAFGLRQKTASKLPQGRKQVIGAWVLAGALLAAELSVMVLPTSLLSAAVGIVSVCAIIIALPFVVPLFAKQMHRLYASMYWLRVATFSASKPVKKYMLFLSLGMTILLLLASLASNVHSVQTYGGMLPLDALVTGIQRPDNALVAAVKKADGVQDAFCASVRYLAVSCGGAEQKLAVVALEPLGFGLFGADASLVQNSGTEMRVAIGKRFADENMLQLGETLAIAEYGVVRQAVVAEILDSNYLDGVFVLAALQHFSTEQKPYTDIFVVADAQSTKAVLDAVSAAVYGRASVIGQQESAELSMAWFREFVWLANLFLIIMSALCFLAMTLLVLMRRTAHSEQTERLKPLGLTKGMEIRHTVVALLFTIFPLLVLSPVILLVLTESAFPVFFVLGARVKMRFYAPSALLTALGVAVAAIAAEAVVCARLFCQQKFSED